PQVQPSDFGDRGVLVEEASKRCILGGACRVMCRILGKRSGRCQGTNCRCS
ncbi:hypothetical protein CEXT_764831, partial [Caerostris extrusa]